MGNPGFTVDQGELERLAGRLRSGASDLESPAGDAPNAPDAGVSTAAVTGALAEIARGVIGLDETILEVADNVAQSHGDYQETDQSNAGNLQGHGPH